MIMFCLKYSRQMLLNLGNTVVYLSITSMVFPISQFL